MPRVTELGSEKLLRGTIYIMYQAGLEIILGKKSNNYLILYEDVYLQYPYIITMRYFL